MVANPLPLGRGLCKPFYLPLHLPFAKNTFIISHLQIRLSFLMTSRVTLALNFNYRVVDKAQPDGSSLILNWNT
jgi:hypothetical protein